MELQLYINNVWQRIETDKNANTLTLVHQFDSLINPSDYYSEFAYTFKVPKTSYNSRLFRGCDKLDFTVSTFDPSASYLYRLYGENTQLLSVGRAMITTINDKEFNVQLNGSLGIAFKNLVNSGFDKSNGDSNYFLLPDYVNFDGSTYNADLRINNGLVGCSWSLDSTTPFHSLSDLKTNYSNLQTAYNDSTHTNQQLFASSIVGFMPQQQGRLKSFDNSKWTYLNTIYPILQTLEQTQEIPTGDGLTEYQMQQYRSYYQQPFVYVQKLWEIYKENAESITGYTLQLDERFFNADNSYLRDTVYTLPNMGNNQPDKVDPSNTRNETYSQNTTLPTNASYDYDTGVTNLSTVTNYIYSGYYTVGAKQTIEQVAEIPLKFYNPNNVIRTYSMEQSQEGAKDKAFNSNNPIVATWDILDSGNNVIASTQRAFLIVPLLKNNEFTETWEMPLHEQFEQITDVIQYYYAGHSKYEDRNNADFGRFQVSCRWKNNGASQSVRVRWSFHFLYDRIPFKNYRYSISEIIDPPQVHDNLYTGGDANGFPTWQITDGSSVTNIYDPVRSDSRLTMDRLFTGVKPFEILLKYSKLYNLVWLIDDNAKTITVKRRADYYKDCLNNGGFLDISERVDKSKGITIEVAPYRCNKVLLGFKESNDNYVKQYKDKFNKMYGELTLNTGDRETTETVEVFNKSENSTFYPPMVASAIDTPRSKMENLLTDKYETFPFPSNITDSGEAANVNGVFYFRCSPQPVPDDNFTVYRDGTTPYVLITDDDATEINNNVYCHHSSNGGVKVKSFPTFYEHSRDNAVCLWFGEPRQMYYDVPQAVIDNSQSVYNTEWKSYITESYNAVNRRITLYAVIDGKIYDRIKTNPLLKVQNVVYIVEKLEFNPSNKYGKFVLREITKVPTD